MKPFLLLERSAALLGRFSPPRASHCVHAALCLDGGMSISDPLTQLREFTIANREVTRQGEYLIFGGSRFPRSALTAYRERNGKGDYYALDSLWFFLQNSSDVHAQYVQKCGQEGIKVVSLADKKQLLSYLKGQISEAAAVDYAKYEPVHPESVSESAAAEQDVQADVAMDVEVDESSRAEMAAEKSKAIAAARAHFLQVLERPREAGGGEAAAKDADAAAEADADAAGEAGEAGGAAAKKESLMSLARPYLREDREKTKLITKREKRLRAPPAEPFERGLRPRPRPPQQEPRWRARCAPVGQCLLYVPSFARPTHPSRPPPAPRPHSYPPAHTRAAPSLSGQRLMLAVAHRSQARASRCCLLRRPRPSRSSRRSSTTSRGATSS